jgi:hypothetical protein
MSWAIYISIFWALEGLLFSVDDIYLLVPHSVFINMFFFYYYIVLVYCQNTSEWPTFRLLISNLTILHVQWNLTILHVKSYYQRMCKLTDVELSDI